MPVNWPRPRFSIRSLMIVTAIFAVVVYAGILPDLAIQRLKDAIARGDLQAADRLFVGEGKLSQHGIDSQLSGANVTVSPITWRQRFTGEREVEVHFPGVGFANGDELSPLNVKADVRFNTIRVRYFERPGWTRW